MVDEYRDKSRNCEILWHCLGHCFMNVTQKQRQENQSSYCNQNVYTQQ